jgi:2-amino-4-hydroxy-6-hydroxymethyldihydropteridine diphosphokinase
MAKWVEIYLGLGSNLGEREVNLMRAVTMLDEALGTHPERISRIIETPADGFEGPDFLNMCIMYRLKPDAPAVEHASALLHRIKDIEKTLGRDGNVEFDAQGNRIYHDRPIDIDILFYGNEAINTEELTIPHPRIAERDFVKIPLREIAKKSLREAFPDIFA